MLKHGDSLGERERLLLERVRVNGEQLLSLVHDVLDLSLIRSGRMELRLEPVPLDGLIREAASDHAATLRGKGLSLEIEVPEPLNPVLTDREKLRRILTGLIENALKFTDKGGVTVAVLAEDGAPRAIEVRDTGPGIPEDGLERIFQSFERANSNGGAARAGLGLGLAICHSLCLRMGCRIEARNAPGGGAVFTVYLDPTANRSAPALTVSAIPSQRP